MSEGVVTHWYSSFGWIRDLSAVRDAPKLFVHLSDVLGEERLYHGDVVSFTPVETAKGPRAISVVYICPEEEYEVRKMNREKHEQGEA